MHAFRSREFEDARNCERQIQVALSHGGKSSGHFWDALYVAIFCRASVVNRLPCFSAVQDGRCDRWPSGTVVGWWYSGHVMCASQYAARVWCGQCVLLLSRVIIITLLPVLSTFRADGFCGEKFHLQRLKKIFFFYQRIFTIPRDFSATDMFICILCWWFYSKTFFELASELVSLNSSAFD